MNNLVIQKSDSSWRSLAMCSTESARKHLSFNRAVQLSSLPLGVFNRDGQVLLNVALSDPKNSMALSFATGYEISHEIVDESEIQKAIELAYCGSVSNIDDAPGLLRKILLKADFLLSSDVHIEPGAKEVRIRFRKDGRLVREKINTLKLEIYEDFVRHVKVKSNLDTTEKNRSQEGSLSFEIADTIKKIRVSILPVLHGEKIAFRLQSNSFLESKNSNTQINFLELGLTHEQAKMLEFSLSMDRGCIIVAGATGSGKTTLLYSALRSLDSGSLNIVTVEDPVEFELNSVNQIRVKGDLSEILPSVLRQDPDVLMVGEIRKARSADLALGASLTGSLVLSSVHAANALEAFTRLSDMGMSNSKIASSVKLVIASRLIAQNCPQCRVKVDATKSFVNYFNLRTSVIYSSKGCSVCSDTGRLGRIGVYEFLPMTSKLREAIFSDEKPTFDGESLFEIAQLNGYEPIKTRMSDLLSKGMVSPEEVCKSLGFSLSMFR